MRHIRRLLARVSAQGATLVLVATITLMLTLAPSPLAAHASANGGTSARLASSPALVASPHIHILPIRGKTGTSSAINSQGKSDLMDYFGGPVGRTNTNYLIFWEPPTLQDGAPTHVSATYNRLIKRYFYDVGGTGLYNNSTQYYDTTGPIANSSTLGGVYLDKSPYPASGCQAAPTPDGCLTEAQVQAEVAKAMGVNGWTAGTEHIFFVYLSAGEGSCYGSAAHSSCYLTTFCAYHTLTLIGGQNVLSALLPYPSAQCLGNVAPNNDPAADTEIDDTSHEQMEAVTDPEFNGWHATPHFNEIGDLCVFNFGPMTFDGGQANQAWGPNGTDYYVVQEEWSNASNSCVQAGP